MDVYHQVKRRLQAPILTRKFNVSHWFHPVVGSSGYQNFFGCPNFLRYGASLARASCAHGAPLQMTSFH